MSFKTRPGSKHQKVSEVAMTQTQRAAHRKRKYKPRKKSTTILVRNELIDELNVNEIKIQKDGEIETIELTIGEKKFAIVAIHVKSSSDTRKKEKFYGKLATLIRDNIGDETTILIGGNANSTWTQQDTSNKEKKTDKTIKQFCKKQGYKDICRKRWKKEHKETKERQFTWESDTEELAKRLDRFWGNKV